jgi:hypothetical protein
MRGDQIYDVADAFITEDDIASLREPPREDGPSRDKDHLEKLDRRLDREKVVAAEDLHSFQMCARTGPSISLHD